MKAVILFLLVCLTWNGRAQTALSYTPDSLKKGDYLTIETVRYYPYVAPGIKEELPWRAENIRRAILQATVTEESRNTLTFEFKLESLYDCRNDSKKNGFYYFDSHYQKDFGLDNSLKDKHISRITFDRKSGKALSADNSDIEYAYSTVYVPHGVRQNALSAYSVNPEKDTLYFSPILTSIIHDFLSGWKKNGTILSIPGMRIIDASFELSPNTEFSFNHYDSGRGKDSSVYKKIFLAYPTEYQMGNFNRILLTPGDSVFQYRTYFAGNNTLRYLGRGKEQNEYASRFLFYAYGYERHDTSTPEKLKRAFHLRDSIYPIVMKNDFEKMNPYWKRVFELTEQYMKSNALMGNYTNSADPEAWSKSSLLDWDAPYFASVDPLIDYAYSHKSYDMIYYNKFLYYYSVYKMQELRADNLNPNKQKKPDPEESYMMNKQFFSGYPKYWINSVNLNTMMRRKMLSETQGDYNDYIASCPDTALTGDLKRTQAMLSPFEAGCNIRETDLMITDSLPLVKKSDRKYILLYLFIGPTGNEKNIQKIIDWRQLLKSEGMEQSVRFEAYGRVSPIHSKKVKELYKALPNEQLQDLIYNKKITSLMILMREDGTIISRQADHPDMKAMLDLAKKDKMRKEKETGLQYFLYGCIAATLLAIGFNYQLRRRMKAKQKQEQTKRQICELELRAIRSQMNPHFIFNALSSIQNLINREANKEANEYLINFSRLLRKVLATSEKKLVPLSDEIEQIQLYLKLEQLRFPFAYSLIMDETIEPDLIEIPGMLIQPFVENAVKHGIAPRGTGKIEIHISLQDQRLEVDIIDDGPGICTDKNDGFGIRAINNQFEILKTIYNTEINITIENRQEKEKVPGCRVKLSIPL